MKRNGFVEGYRVSLPGGRSIKWLLAILFLCILTLLGVGKAMAAFAWGTVTGPVWLDPNPGYRFTINVTTMSQDDHYVCLAYTVGTTTTTALCSCTAPDCTPSTGLGVWVCTVPSNYSSTTVGWDMSSYVNSSCGLKKTQGPTGNFNTGPNAITLDYFKAGSGERSPSSLAIIPIVIVSIGGFLGLLYRKHRVGSSLAGDTGK